MAREREITVGDRIRARMVLMHISTKDMARAFRHGNRQITDRTYRWWLEDCESRLTIGRLRVIAAMLKTTPADLMGD